MIEQIANLRLRSAALHFVCALVLTSSANAQAKPKICETKAGLADRHHLYEGCIASQARKLEISGDAAETVATAVIGACDEDMRRIVSYIDACIGPAGVGIETMRKTAKHYRDYAIRAVIEFRAARRSKGPPGNSN
jgi:hypothetical protein